MSRTDILITPCGGVGTVLTFLPPGATAIVMNYWHTTLQASVQMERNYYWNLEYLDIHFFPVLAEDYELTTDRPSCEKGPDDPYLEGQVGYLYYHDQRSMCMSYLVDSICLFVYVSITFTHASVCTYTHPMHPVIRSSSIHTVTCTWSVLY